MGDLGPELTLTGHVTPSSVQKSKSTCPRATPKTLTVMVYLSPATTSCFGVAVKATVRFWPGIGESGVTSQAVIPRFSVPHDLKSWAYADAAKSRRTVWAEQLDQSGVVNQFSQGTLASMELFISCCHT